MKKRYWIRKTICTADADNKYRSEPTVQMKYLTYLNCNWTCTIVSDAAGVYKSRAMHGCKAFIVNRAKHSFIAKSIALLLTLASYELSGWQGTKCRDWNTLFHALALARQVAIKIWLSCQETSLPSPVNDSDLPRKTLAQRTSWQNFYLSFLNFTGCR